MNSPRLDAASRAKLLRRSETDLSSFMEKVRPIIEAVRLEGDVALARFGRELDGAAVTPDTLEASEQEFDAAFSAVEPEVIDLDPLRHRQYPHLP